MVVQLTLPRPNEDVVPGSAACGTVDSLEEELTSPGVVAWGRRSSSTSSGISPQDPKGSADQLIRRAHGEKHRVPFGSEQLSQSCPSTSEEEKKKVFRNYLTLILSCMYAIFILMLGIVIYIADLFCIKANIAEVFSMFLVVPGLCWLIFFYVDIRFYQGSVRSHCRHIARMNDDLLFNSLTKDLPPLPPPKVQYAFSRGHNSASFYLKIGAAGFCFGHLIHTGLILSRQIIYFTSADPLVYQECANVIVLILDILYPLYSFFQLFIIFKYSNVIINRYKVLSSFSLMHCIASSLCFWFSTILRETIDSLQEMMREHQHYKGHHDSLASESAHMSALMVSNESVICVFNGSALKFDVCVGKLPISSLVFGLTPYLYPFSIEYSILIVGILFIIWQNIGNHHELKQQRQLLQKRISSAGSCPQNHSLTNHLVLHADCQSANKGLFAGLFVLVGTVISIIIFYMSTHDHFDDNTTLLINQSSQVVLLVLMSGAVLIAYRQISRLDVKRQPISCLDDLLLFICLPSFFLYAILTILPTIVGGNYYCLAVSLLQVFQVVLQTPFIIDGLRRCSNNASLKKSKPGRELVTFLVVCNIAMWIIETFEIKSAQVHAHHILFYGNVPWTLLCHITLPLTLFYRFHSSACLVDIWKGAYETGE